MNLSQLLIEALESLNSNKMRSGLTVLGIVIGVAAVIAMLAVGNGAQASITGSINQVGTNLLFVFSGARDNPGPTSDNPRPVTIGRCECADGPICGAAYPGRGAGFAGKRHCGFGGQTKSTTIVGVTPSYQPVRNISLLEGDFITDAAKPRAGFCHRDRRGCGG